MERMPRRVYKLEWLDSVKKVILRVYSWSAEGEQYGKTQPEAHDLAPLGKVIAVNLGTNTSMPVMELRDGRFSRKARS